MRQNLIDVAAPTTDGQGAERRQNLAPSLERDHQDGETLLTRALVEACPAHKHADNHGSDTPEKRRNAPMIQQDKMTLAQRALQQYDDRQETQFLDLLVNQRAQNPHREALLSAAWENHRYHLQDGSAVQIHLQQKEIDFTWPGHLESRPNRIPEDRLPPYPGSSRSLLQDWPTSETVMTAIMQSLELEEAPEGQRQEHNDQPPVGPAEALLNAPGLHREIVEYIQNHYDLPQRLLEDLDQETQFCAQEVLKRLPPQELQQLRQATRQRIAEEDGEDDQE